MASSFVFRSDDSCPDLVREVFLSRGFHEFDEEEDDDSLGWNIFWRSSHFRPRYHQELLPYQRLTHFPKSGIITRKDSLLRSLRLMQAVHGIKVYDYFPEGYILPNDYTKFVDACQRHPSALWICKPADLSRGRGISLLRDMNELMYDGPAVVQRYIPDPLLVSGYKCDLRLYVAVVSFHPLVVYIHEQGLARFATEKFDLSCLDNVYSHLTNTSINKYSPTYAQGKEGVGFGCKWSLSQFRSYLAGHDEDNPILWRRISNIVILTLLAQTPSVPLVHNCVELYGFDILIDEKLKPWLLEVNFSPALHCDSRVDMVVKKPMLNDLLDLLGLSDNDKIPPALRSKVKPERAMHSVPQRRVSHTVPPTRRSLQSFAGSQLRVPRPVTTFQLNGQVDARERVRNNSSKRQLLAARLTPIVRPIMQISQPTRHLTATTRQRKTDQATKRPSTSLPARHQTLSPRLADCHSASCRSDECTTSRSDTSLSSKTTTDEAALTPFLYGTIHDMSAFVRDDGCTYTIYGDGSPRTQYRGDNERVRLPPRVGGFVLVFPFNEATRKASLGMPAHARAITREIRKEAKKGTTLWAPQLL